MTAKCWPVHHPHSINGFSMARKGKYVTVTSGASMHLREGHAGSMFA
jgi:hypothetical protein